MDAFFEKVWKVTRAIPYGRVSTYGAIAQFVGSGRAARMAGYAMNKSFAAPEWVPAHRVVNRQGILTGQHHFPQSGMMQSLLQQEGIRVEDDTVVDFEKVFWDPGKHLPASFLD